MNERTRRGVLGAGIPAAVVGAGLGPYLAYRSDLPDRVASHFGISGRADDSMTPELFLIVIGALMVTGLGMCMAVALIRRKLQPMVAPGASFIGAFIGRWRQESSPPPPSARGGWNGGRRRRCPHGL